MTLVAKMKTARALLAMLFCALSTLAHAGSLNWSMDRSGGSPYKLRIDLDGVWHNFGEITSAGQPLPYFAVTFCGANEWITATAGVPSCAQPAFSNISGAILTAQITDLNVTADKLAAGVAVANIGYTPANKAGDVLTGNFDVSKSNPRLNLVKAASGESAGVIGRISPSLARWGVFLGDAAAEGGANAGSDFVVARYSDAGTLIDNVLSINRANGILTYLQNIKIAAGKYLNFGATDGASGYGFWDDGGVIKSKDSGGAWASISAVMQGDSGSGGVKGIVPAPAAGDAAAGKFLKADATWAVPAGGGGGSSTLIANSFPNVDPTGVADSAAGLNAVIASCPAGGCTIELCGDYSVSASLVIGDGTNSTPSTKQGVRLVGCGKPNIAQYDGWAGYSSAIATRIKWTGGSGAVINLAGPLRGWGLENLFIDCNNTASTTGIQNISASVGSAENISIRLCTRGILSTTRTFTGAGFHGSASAFNNTYKHFSIYVRNEASAMGMFLDGVYQAAGSIGATTCPCLASTTVSSFEDFYILMGSSTNAQYGVYLRVADTNTFKNIGVLLNPTPGSRGILWDYASNSTLPANNAFHEGYVSSVLGTGTTNTHVNSGTAPAGATTHNWVDRPALINGDTWSTITNTIVTSP